MLLRVASCQPFELGRPLLSVEIGAAYAPDSPVLRRVKFEIQPGEILGLAGQSGSGKSTIALAILGLLHLKGGRLTGQIRFRGQDLLNTPEKEMRRLRGREIALVLQNPISSLNPAMRVGRQLAEAFAAHNPASGDVRDAAIQEAFQAVSLSIEDGLLRRYPGELSVGQAQRVLIAMAILHRPSLLIADEPTSALDVVTQAEILRLFARLNRELSMAILFISHDLLSMASLAARVAILQQGDIVECAPVQDIFLNPSHPATRRLIEAIPRPPFPANPAPFWMAASKLS